MSTIRKKALAKKLLPKKASEARTIKRGDEYDVKASALGKSPVTKQASYKMQTKISHLEEPVSSYTSRIRAIGNSRGVILNNQLIEAAGLKPEIDVVINAGKGVIYIVQVKEASVNSDLSSWDKQFKAAIKKGAKPEKDLFEGLNNDFDTKEW